MQLRVSAARRCGSRRRVAADQVDAGAAVEGELHDRGTIPPVRELVIVIADLYLPAAPTARRAAPARAARARALARFGAAACLQRGWRAWLARRCGRARILPARAPARIAAAARRARRLAGPAVARDPGALSRRTLERAPGSARPAAACALRSCAQLAQDFARAFAGSGLALHAARAAASCCSRAPGVRCAWRPRAGALRRRARSARPAARRRPRAAAHLARRSRCGCTSMPLNRGARARGELPVTRCGCGAAGAAARRRERLRGRAQRRCRAYGRDPYLRGLWRSCRAHARSRCRQDLEAVLGARRAVAPCSVSSWRAAADRRTERSPRRSRELERAGSPRRCAALRARRARARSRCSPTTAVSTLRPPQRPEVWRRARARAGGASREPARSCAARAARRTRLRSRELHPVLAARLRRARRAHGARSWTSRSSGCCRSAPSRASPRRSSCCSQHRAAGRVLVIGDFDADGATSTRADGARAARLGLRRGRLPGAEPLRVRLRPDARRSSRSRAARAPTLIVTVDNGISSHAGVAAARARGIDVLITDHHLPGARAAATANVIVNPNLAGSRFGSRALAGVGVAFYVMAALRRRARCSRHAAPPGAPRVARVAGPGGARHGRRRRAARCQQPRAGGAGPAAHPRRALRARHPRAARRRAARAART